ncbi:MULTISPECIES: replication/maintenance protein RepL [unclassified Staphylococcus]|uniref:Replication protein n=3 Tax=Staphylococcus TaxID=1279 RepID=V5RMZ8_9STAP|nr:MULTISPECIES: replication/maintenance protein RepL [unclassified Staphylococcus]AHB37621.1 replication protein [Staphylococcus cohnii]CCE60908.1 replication protein [Staphylococcus aureus]
MSSILITPWSVMIQVVSKMIHIRITACYIFEKGEKVIMAEIHVGAEREVLKPNSMSFEERKIQMEKEEEIEKEIRKRDKNSPYKRWIQLNKDAYKAEDWLMAKSPIAYRIFKFLINNMDSYNAVMCSYKVLEEQFEVSTSTVTRAVKLLKDKQYIDVYKSGTSNVYAVNKQIAWNSWGSNFKHGKFSANVILSESEQDKQTKLKIQRHKEVTLEEI